MKTLANCNPVEFLKQTNKIRHAVSHLLQDSGVMEIRKHLPKLTGEESPQEKKEKEREQLPAKTKKKIENASICKRMSP